MDVIASTNFFSAILFLLFSVFSALSGCLWRLSAYFVKKGWYTFFHPDQGPESGGTTLLNAVTFSFHTVIAGATLYFHTELQGRFGILAHKDLSAPAFPPGIFSLKGAYPY